MAESAVSFLLEALSAVLRDELNLLGGLKQEVESIKHELENLKEFLKVADAKEDTDTSLKETVGQLREIAYDIEDVLSKCMLRFRPRRRGTNGCGRFLNKVKNLKFRRQIASEIETLNSTLSNVVKSQQKYRELYSCMEQGSSSTVAAETEGYDGRGDALFSEVGKIVGFKKPKKKLKKWVYEAMDSGRGVISVVGMGGSGKTTLAKKVYDDIDIIPLFDRHVWMVVSDYKNNIEHFFLDLIQKLVGETMESQPQVLNRNIDELRKIVHGFLHQKKYIIVLDDVSELSTWDAIEPALPRKDGLGCIIITARNHNIGTHACGETDRVHHLERLSEGKAQKLFFKKAFQGSSCPDDLLVYATSIVKRCAGLPLAIIVIGSLLAKKEKSAYEWDLFNRSISHELEGGDDLARLRRLFAVSYNDLPFYLKYCFSYLSIFPEGGLLEKEKILRLWAAEGFVQLEQNLSLEEVANKYLNALCNRSLLQVVEKHDDGRVRVFRIHDLLRDYITSISRDHNIVTVCNGQQDQLWPNKIRRLAIQINSAKIDVETINVDHLRSLLFSNGDMEIRMFKEFVTRCRLLKVLDIRGAQIESIPNEVFRLYHLKYLCLRDTEIKLIPKSIKNLVNLETLDLKNTNVIYLPKEILKLQRLRHLLMYKYNVSDWYKVQFGHMQSFRAPYNIGASLQSLQNLCFLEADEVIVREIGKLTQLRRLGIAKLRSEHGKILCSSISNLTSLRSLTIGSSEEGVNLDIDYPLSASKVLRALFLSGYMEKIPQWISSLQSLSTLHLRWSKLRLDSDPLTSLQGLPNLTCLLIQDVDVKGLSFKSDGFQKLKVLRLYDMQLMNWIKVEKGSMPSLHEWDVCNCELLTEVPRGIEHLNILKYLGFHDMPENFKNMLVEGRRGEGGSWRLARVTHIYFSSVREEVREYSSLDDLLES